MRIIILIITILFSGVCFGQTKSIDVSKVNHSDKVDLLKPYGTWKDTSGKELQEKLKVDSMDLKVISMKEFNAYLEKINLVIKKQFDLTEVTKYEQILKTIQSVYAEADKKRRMK